MIPVEPALDEKLDIMLEHVSLAVADKGEHTAMMEARRVAGWYLKGCAARRSSAFYAAALRPMRI